MKAYSSNTRNAALMLRGAGHGCGRIAKLVGVSKSTVKRWVDPEYAEHLRQLARERKETYRGECVDCGAPTSYSGVGTNGSERCRPCRKKIEQSEAYRVERQLWTRERIILAIQEWARIYGEPPATPDWNPTGARYLGDEERALRFERANGKWPWFSLVVNRFGSWNAGIEAAGFSGRCNTGGCGNSTRTRSMRAKLGQP